MSGCAAKRLLKRSTVCGVSEISGTSTIAVLPARERGADRLQINFGFAAAGHAVEQDRRMRFRIFERGFDQLQGGGLFFIHRQLGIGDEFLRAVRDRAPRLVRAVRRIRA